MKKILFLIAILAASLTLAACNKTPKSGTTAQQDEALMSGTNYVLYTPQAVETAQSDQQRVALFFHSKTCSSCASLNKDIMNNLKNIPDDVTIIKVDWDDNQALAKEYGVTSYHTITYLDKEENKSGIGTLEKLLEGFEADEEEDADMGAPDLDNQDNDEDDNNDVEDNTDTAEEEAENNQDDDTDNNDDTSLSYKLYSPENLQAAIDNNKRIVLNFKASRCPVCKATTANIQENIASLPSDVVILETDYDEYTDLKKEYKVVKQTTFVFLDNKGEYIKTVENVRNMDNVIENL